ncbi:hypothetical protein AKG39_04950 [Acetobacterium bakii]|uniref:SAM-dependent methyltransferase n=2 Tax=Acetobacterium bakii TaxID=52689 RepID=A0A0L6U4I3_9FIRM|nr:hypothetical protein AKG39_04950 [Acetobacterium bakii]
MELNPRLRVIAGCVTDVKTMADIGTDHGYLPVALIEKGKLVSAIACDVNEKPLEKAKKIIEDYGFDSSIETRLGSGLSVLKPEEAEAIVIAGMGGLLIRDLLEAEPEVAAAAKKLVLQPMNNQAVVRRYLETNGFKIIHEDLAREGDRIYEIIVAQKGVMIVEDHLDYELGYRATQTKHPLLEAHINRKIRFEEKILDHTRGKTTAIARKQFTESQAYIKRLNEVKKCL